MAAYSIYKTRHSHWNTGVFNKDPSLKTAKMAMAVRDPRDAILSIFRMWRFANMDQCVNQFCGIKYEYKPMGVFHREGWPGYVRDWLDYGVPYVRYEDLLERPHETLVKLISDLGLPPQPDAAIYAAIENNKFNPKTQSVKGQKGISGRWKTELTGKHLNAVQNSCRHIMERLGYES